MCFDCTSSLLCCTFQRLIFEFNCIFHSRLTGSISANPWYTFSLCIHCCCCCCVASEQEFRFICTRAICACNGLTCFLCRPLLLLYWWSLSISREISPFWNCQYKTTVFPVFHLQSSTLVWHVNYVCVIHTVYVRRFRPNCFTPYQPSQPFLTTNDTNKKIELNERLINHLM